VIPAKKRKRRILGEKKKGAFFGGKGGARQPPHGPGLCGRERVSKKKCSGPRPDAPAEKKKEKHAAARTRCAKKTSERKVEYWEKGKPA